MIDPENIEAIYPLSESQSGFLFEYLSGGGRDVGRVQVVIEGEGELSFDVARQAWGDVVAAQPALRCSFRWRKIKKPQCIVFRSVQWDSNVSVLSLRDGEGSIAELVAQDHGLPLDLDAVPTWRWTLINGAKDRFTILWTCHHAFLDGWSAAVIIRQWFRRLNQVFRGASSDVENYQSAFRDMIRWSNGRDLSQLGDYWCGRLKGRLEMPYLASKLVKRENSRNRGQERLGLSRELSSSLRASLARLRIPGNVLAVGAWTVVLRYWCRTSEVVTGTIVSGRGRQIEGGDDVAGMYSGFIPVVVDCARGDDLFAWFSHLKEQLLEGQLRAPGTLGELES